jgi:hypothetical protein
MAPDRARVNVPCPNTGALGRLPGLARNSHSAPALPDVLVLFFRVL